MSCRHGESVTGCDQCVAEDALINEIATLREEIVDHARAYELLFKENSTLRKERDELLQENRMLLEAYAVELEQRLAGQVPPHAAVGDEK